MALQYTETQRTESVAGTASTQLTSKHENSGQDLLHQSSQQQQHQNGYHDPSTVMWATTTNQHSISEEMASDYSAAPAPAMIVSPPQQHTYSHCSVTAPAYHHLNRNRSWMSGPPSPPLHHSSSWFTAFGTNSNSTSITSTWTGPPPVDAWKYPTLYQDASRTIIPVSYQDQLSRGGPIKDAETSSFSARRAPPDHDSETRHCISPTSPSPSTSYNSPTSIQQPPSSSLSLMKRKKQPRDHGNDKTEEETKRLLYLAKNRQAASKCRQRKKEWIAQMQETMASFVAENDVLQQQVFMLREEVLSLKSLLLMCKDCPQAQANGVYGLDSMASSSSN